MLGVDDVYDASAYMISTRWIRRVTSRFAMQCLIKLESPEHAHRQMELIERTDDPVTQDLAFVSQFHERVYRRRELRIHRLKYGYCEPGSSRYDQMVWDGSATESTANKLGRIEDRKGRTLAECEAIASSWAANPSMLDYWIPQTSWTGVPDAVIKWTSPETRNPEFYLLRLIRTAEQRVVMTAWVRKLTRIFQDKGFRVSLLVILPDEATMRSFCCLPESVTTEMMVYCGCLA